jgi:hypothetical protein
MKATMRNQLEANKMTVVVQVALASHPELKTVPLAMEFATTDAAKELIRVGSLMYSSALRPYAAPPGTPPERLELLRKAFRETMRDAEFLADAKQAQIEIDPIDAVERAQSQRAAPRHPKVRPAARRIRFDKRRPTLGVGGPAKFLLRRGCNRQRHWRKHKEAHKQSQRCQLPTAIPPLIYSGPNH